MHSEPWFRKHDGWWYFYRLEGGKRRPVKLVKGKGNRDAAYDRWHELCRTPVSQPVVSSDAVVALVDLYLDWLQKNRSKGTYDIYLHHLQSFCRHIGPDLTAAELKPRHVTAWLQGADWSDSTKAGAVQTVRTAFHWLVREGYLTSSPVANAKGPSKKNREVILTPEQYKAVLNNSRPDFRQLLEFLRHTGCRPQEAVAVEAKHCELEQRRIVFPPSQSKGKKHHRVIWLSDQALALVRVMCRKFPEGKLLRTSRGKPWNRNIIRCRFRRLSEKVGEQFCAYHLRHTFATEALQRLDPITVAALMGHTDGGATLAKNYQHLAKLPAHMLQAANRAVE